MAFNYEYPYADLSRANIDWLLNTMKELKTTVQTMIDEYGHVDEILQKAFDYTDESIAPIKQELTVVNNALQSLRNDLTNSVESLEALIANTERDILVDVNDKYIRNQQAIAQQWTDMVNYINNQVIDIKVRNFFTGQLTSIQAMFDYLSRFHLDDAATYTEVTGLNTYAYYEAKNKTYEEVTMDSKTFFEVP